GARGCAEPRQPPDHQVPAGRTPARPPGPGARAEPKYISSTIRLIFWHVKPKLNNSRALRIIAAAREEFSRRGFDGARVDQIARKAGVNKQLLFYYFHSKRGLFNAVLALGAAQLEHALAGLPLVGNPPEPDPLSRIRTALEAQFDFLAEHPELVALLTQAG